MINVEFLNRVRKLVEIWETEEDMEDYVVNSLLQLSTEKSNSDDAEIIGHLVVRNGRFVVYGKCCIPCLKIDELERPTNVYRVNIGDYKQLCYNCGAVLVKGKTESWPELFDTFPDIKEKAQKDIDKITEV